jgi:hypothetical protein
MSDIFISYASEDRPRAAAIAKALETQGWSLWWDRNIPAGRRFAEVIQEEIGKARCMVVLWSAVSVKRDWVIDEASEGKARGILVPVRIEPVEPPFGFRQIQTADLAGWRGDSSGVAFRALCQAIVAILSSDPQRPSSSGSGQLGVEARLEQIASLVSMKDPAGSRRHLHTFKFEALAQSSDEVLDRAVTLLMGRLEFVATQEGAPMAVRLLRQEIFESIKALAPKPLGSYFERGELEGMDLYGFDFSGADLRNVSLRHAFLVEANFAEANLDQADFTRCYMRNGNFSRASLAGANLTDADWFNARGLAEEQLAEARRDTVAACPGNVEAIEEYLRSKYGFPMESWEPRLQEQLRSTWRQYLAPGGLCAFAARLNHL